MTSGFVCISCTHGVQENMTSGFVCISCTHGVQENGPIDLVELQTAEILGLIICFVIHFLFLTIE